MADYLVIAQVVGCAVGAILSLFLATLAWRSHEKGRGARILYATCALVFSLCGVMHGAFALLGSTAMLKDVTGMLRLTAAALWPTSAIGMWLEDDGLSSRRRHLGQLLFRGAIVSAGLIVLAGVVTVWIVPRLHADAALRDVLLMYRVHGAASYSGFSAIAAGVWLLVRNQDQGRFQQFAVWTMLTGLSIGAVCIVVCGLFALQPPTRSLVLLAKEQAVTLILIGTLFYFARFRAVDVFLKLSLRLFVVATVALIAAGLALGPIQSLANDSTAPFAFAVIGYTALIGAVVLLLQRVSRMTDAIVERYIFGKPDYGRAAVELQERVALLESEAEVIAKTEEFVGRTLGMLKVRVHPGDAATEGANAEDTVEAPILVGTQSPYVLTVSSRSREHIVMTVDVDFLRNVAVIVGRRLEALAREKERMERARREAQLVHQIVSAELRALRAQLNPHFLFNALNTIAALIPHESEKAEAMVVQLAKVFRHLLTHSEKSFSSLQEELEFLRTYLDIEKLRFGERLTVEFDIGQDVVTATIPSLILQPLVENALKHGLAAKRGDNQLMIRAGRSGDALSLAVEDNGVGISAGRIERASGVGLRNIRERLRTIYGPRASLVLENIAHGGSRALVIIPVVETA
jgi:two-component system LytT family sensor kinase